MLGTAEFWVAIALVLLVLVIGKKVWLSLSSTLDKRSDAIKNQIDQAENLLDQAQNMFATYQQKQEEAIDRSVEIVSHSENEAMELKRSTERELAHQMAIKEESCISRINQLKEDAKIELKDSLVEESMRIVQLVLQDQKMTGALVTENTQDLLKDAKINNLVA